MNSLPGYAGAIVNPALSLAIESTRRFLKDAGLEMPPKGPLLDRAMFPKWPGNGMPDIDDREQLIKWQSDSRFAVLGFEVVSGMSFVPLPKDRQGISNGGKLCVLHPSLSDKGDSAKATSFDLVTMTRPTLEVLQQQARKVFEQANNRLMPRSEELSRRERLTEITSQVVPPFAFWCAALPIHPDRMPRTMELIDLTLMLTNFAAQRFKHALAVTRPNQIDAAVFPAILTPAHASLPSGHSSEAFAVSNVLLSLLSEDLDEKDRRPGAGSGKPDAKSASPDAKDPNAARRGRSGSELGKRMLALAARIANNREVAGLHYPVDTFSGRLLGTVLASYLVARCTGSSFQPGNFDGAGLDVDREGDLVRKGSKVTGPDEFGQGLASGADAVCTLGMPVSPLKSEALSWLWDRARAEWGYSPKESGVENQPSADGNEHRSAL